MMPENILLMLCYNMLKLEVKIWKDQNKSFYKKTSSMLGIQMIDSFAWQD